MRTNSNMVVPSTKHYESRETRNDYSARASAAKPVQFHYAGKVPAAKRSALPPENFGPTIHDIHPTVAKYWPRATMRLVTLSNRSALVASLVGVALLLVAGPRARRALSRCRSAGGAAKSPAGSAGQQRNAAGRAQGARVGRQRADPAFPRRRDSAAPGQPARRTDRAARSSLRWHDPSPPGHRRSVLEPIRISIRPRIVSRSVPIRSGSNRQFVVRRIAVRDGVAVRACWQIGRDPDEHRPPYPNWKEYAPQPGDARLRSGWIEQPNCPRGSHFPSGIESTPGRWPRMPRIASSTWSWRRRCCRNSNRSRSIGPRFIISTPAGLPRRSRLPIILATGTPCASGNIARSWLRSPPNSGSRFRRDDCPLRKCDPWAALRPDRVNDRRAQAPNSKAHCRSKSGLPAAVLRTTM